MVDFFSILVSDLQVLITDALTSSCLLLWDLEYVVCLFATSSWRHGKGQAHQGSECSTEGKGNIVWVKPFIIVLPFWLRFVQCIFLAITEQSLKSVANAVKYLTAIAVVLTSAAQIWDEENKDAWRSVWLGALVVKTGYCFYWDLVCGNFG
jgi:hypothetical protein